MNTLHSTMHKLWLDHVLWTRIVIMDVAAGLPDTDAATQRLMQNQVDIGNAVRPYLGDTAADQLTALLHEHIAGAGAILADLKARRDPAADIAAWYANADRISDLLASAGLGDFRAMMHTHLDTTIAEAQARFAGNWAADIAAYDAVENHILTMADALSAAVGKKAGQETNQFTFGQLLLTGALAALAGYVIAKP